MSIRISTLLGCSILCLCVGALLPLVAARSYRNGLIFYELSTHTPYLPPTVSVSRGRNLASVKYSEKGSIWSTFGQPCECRGSKCGCCAGLKVDQYKFDQKMCANITFMPQQEEAQLEVYLNERPSSKYGISVRNPSPFCIPVMMGVPMAMCVQMTDVTMVGNNLNMCMDFVVRLATTDLFEMHFQCMRMGLDGVMYVDKNGKPVLPNNNTKQTELDDEDEEEELEDELAEEEVAEETETSETEYDYAADIADEQPTDKLLVVVQETNNSQEVDDEEEEVEVAEAEADAEEQQQTSEQQIEEQTELAAFAPPTVPIESEMLMAMDEAEEQTEAEMETEAEVEAEADNDSESNFKQNEVIETITNSISAAAATATEEPITTTIVAATTTTTAKPNIADNNNNNNNIEQEAAKTTTTPPTTENDSDNEVNVDDEEEDDEGEAEEVATEDEAEDDMAAGEIEAEGDTETEADAEVDNSNESVEVASTASPAVAPNNNNNSAPNDNEPAREPVDDNDNGAAIPAATPPALLPSSVAVNYGNDAAEQSAATPTPTATLTGYQRRLYF